MGVSKPRLAFTLLVLLGINTMNFYDRQVPGVVAEPLREALELNDKQLGWVTTAFVLLYAVVGVPLGRWADAGRRTHILALGVIVWSALTAVSGLAWNLASLFVMRLAVGVGEASCAPAANSLLADLFPREQRARAVSVFMLGLPLGLGLSSFISGPVAHVWGWRSAFYVAAVPGLLLGLLCLFLQEPQRGASAPRTSGGGAGHIADMLTVLRIPTMWWIILSGALHNFNMYALGGFLAPLLQRYHGVSTAKAGWINGLIYGLGGLGLFLGGWAADRMVRRRVSGRLETGAWALAAGVPCMYFALGQPAGEWLGFAAWMLPGYTLFYVYYSAVYATIQDIIEPSLRGTAMALYFCAMYLLGGALGPVLTGGLSDHYAGQALADGRANSADAAKALGLHDAMYVVPLLATILVGVMVAAAYTVGRDQRRLQEGRPAASTDEVP